jgi:manganese/iron transport system permease protein
VEPEAPISSWAAFIGAWDLFRNPLLCALVAGAVLGFLGVFVVLRRMVFVSAGVTQSAGLGVALAFYLEIHLGVHLDPLVGAAALALLATLAMSVDSGRRMKLTRESLLGLVFALSGGAAVLLGDRISQEAHDIESILFGSAVLVRTFDLVSVLVAGGLVIAIQLWWLRGLVFASFDPDGARVQGLPVSLLDRTLFVSIGVMVGVSARALGSRPVFAFSVLPAAAALVLGVRLPWAFALATVLGALSGVAGYLFAFFYQFPVGGSQTVMAALFAVLAVLVQLARGRTVRLAMPARARALTPPPP